MKEKPFAKAVDFILENVHNRLKDVDYSKIENCANQILNSNQIFVYGVGRSGIVGKALAMRLVQLGLNAYFIGESTTPVVTEKDTTIIISNLGETYSAILTANIVKRIGSFLIVVTARPQSKLAHAANILIILNAPFNKNFQKKYAPLGTLFEHSALLFFDALIAELLSRKNETEDTMKQRHAIWV